MSKKRHSMVPSEKLLSCWFPYNIKLQHGPPLLLLTYSVSPSFPSFLSLSHSLTLLYAPCKIGQAGWYKPSWIPCAPSITYMHVTSTSYISRMLYLWRYISLKAKFMTFNFPPHSVCVYRLTLDPSLDLLTLQTSTLHTHGERKVDEEEDKFCSAK